MSETEIPNNRPPQKIYRWLGLLAIVLVLGTWFVEFLSVRSLAKRNQSSGVRTISKTDSLEVKMAKFAEQAVLDAERYKVTLDYRVASLDSVDPILGQLGTELRSKGASDEVIGIQGFIWGSYVGEVIRRYHGGEWAEGATVDGHGTYPLTVKSNTVYPCLWCVQRLKGDLSLSVSRSYQDFLITKLITFSNSNNILSDAFTNRPSRP